MNIEKYGFHPSMTYENKSKYINAIPARITAVHRERFAFVSDEGSGNARLKTGEYHKGNQLFPTTGDFVLLEWQAQGESLIVGTLPRKSQFDRLDPSSSGQRAQTVAANFDYVMILQSLGRDFNLRRLERYLTLAWQSGAIPAVVLTKADCVEDYRKELHAAQRLATGVGVFAVSAKTGYGIEQLEDYMRPGKTSVFLGSSGVGKSSLINALAGDEIMETGGIREKDGRGRHTTTHRQLMLLETGAIVIDTPGMRELGMWDVREGLSKSFADIEAYFGQCKFRDCRHQSEPGCAIKAAIAAGELSKEHWESYLRLGAEAKYADNKAGYLRQKGQRLKDISKQQKQGKQTEFQHKPCEETFTCKACGSIVAPEAAGSQHRNHCPKCLSSIHADNTPGDRAALCRGVMDPVGVWVRKNGEWAIIHRCRSCGTFSSNRIAADDNSALLMSIAMKPLALPPFPLASLEGTWNAAVGGESEVHEAQ